MNVRQVPGNGTALLRQLRLGSRPTRRTPRAPCVSMSSWSCRAACRATCQRRSTLRIRIWTDMAHKHLKVAVQMDPIERIDIRGDSTFALLLEAQERRHDIAYYTPDRMALLDGQVFATVAPLTVCDVAGGHFTLGEAKRTPLSVFDVILMRQDPPFDLAYISATHLLEGLHQ